MEACRGSSLASHTAASLVISAKKKAPEFTAQLVEAARLLRLGESLARTAVALLSSCSTSGDAAAGAHRGAPLGEPVARADAASCEPAQKKKKKKRKKKNKDLGGPEVLPYEVGDAMMDVGCRPGPMFVLVLLPATLASASLWFRQVRDTSLMMLSLMVLFSLLVRMSFLSTSLLELSWQE